MKNHHPKYQQSFDHRIRLGIMSVLMVNESADFSTLKELLGVTDGNLATMPKHWNSKTIFPLKNNSLAKNRIPVTGHPERGREKAFQEHIEALEQLIQKKIAVFFYPHALNYKVLFKI